MKPISIQMYSLREEVKKTDAKTVMKKVADIGFKAIEPAGFYEMTPAEYKKLAASFGLEILSSHSPWLNGENTNEVVETMKVLGLDIAAAGYGPDDFKDMDAIKKTADTINKLTDKMEKAGLKLFLHNHAWEFERLDGKIKHHYIAEMCPRVLFEIDTYWATNFGMENPAKELEYFGERAILLHIKDGCFEKGHPNLAVGKGRMNFPEVVKAANQKSVRALVVEFDSCATDMFEAVQESYNYLTKNKFAVGNK